MIGQPLFANASAAEQRSGGSRLFPRDGPQGFIVDNGPGRLASLVGNRAAPFPQPLEEITVDPLPVIGVTLCPDCLLQPGFKQGNVPLVAKHLPRTSIEGHNRSVAAAAGEVVLVEQLVHKILAGALVELSEQAVG